MTIPLPEKYMRPEGGVGKLANYQSTQADTLVAGAAIPYGAPVSAVDGVASVFTTGDLFGVAIAQEYAKEIPYGDGEKVGEYPKSKPVPVLRKGSIWVKVSDDVVQNEKATVDASGFKKAVAEEVVVGVFQSTASANGLAILQINLP